MAEIEREPDVYGGDVQVVSVEYLDAEMEVYDIQVEVDESFIVAGVVVHNSEICRSLDGEVFDIDKGPRPPAHPGCRSTTTAVLKEKFRALEQGRTRRARQPDGDVDYVPASQTYYQWLSKQPASFIDSVIGPTRGKLLRNGGLSAERFAELQLHRNFEPMTLTEMKQVAPLAFERAGLD